MAEEKLPDAQAVRLFLKGHFETQYGDKFRDVVLRKVWLHTGERSVWEAEGEALLKGFLWKKKRRPFIYQLDTKTGAIIGFQEVRG